MTQKESHSTPVSEKDGEWHRYFAVLPVRVDAYDESERKNGKFSYLKVGWVERRWDSFVNVDDEDQIRIEVWRYRICR